MGIDNMDILKHIQWWTGISITGFLTLCIWMWKLQNEVRKSESAMNRKFEKKFDDLLSVVTEIKNAILGTMQNPGKSVLVRLGKVEDRLGDVEKRLAKLDVEN